MRYQQATQLKKVPIKLSTVILSLLLFFLVISVFASNLVLKDIYDRRDQSDIYWNYNKILEKPFKYLKITGGSITNVVFEPGQKSSVRVLNYWDYKRDTMVTADVKNDTLYLTIRNKYNNLGEKFWMKSQVLIRVFSPQLLAVEGDQTDFELQKLKQKNIAISLKGRSRLEVETYDPNFDSINVIQRDSSQVIFEMSPDLKISPIMHFKQVTANMSGYTLLDVGRSYVDHTTLNLADSSAIILSGKSLKSLYK
jgi:hypothetical protein